MEASGNQIPANTFNDGLALVLPEFKGLSSIRLDLESLKLAEQTLAQAQHVNPSTYSHLEHIFGEAYRDLKKHVATIGYQILRTESELEKARAAAILDKYPEFMKDKPAKMDTAVVRDAFISRDTDVQSAKDRLDSLKMMEVFIDGRIKVMENVSRFMKKKMDMYIREGAIGSIR